MPLTLPHRVRRDVLQRIPTTHFLEVTTHWAPARKTNPKLHDCIAPTDDRYLSPVRGTMRNGLSVS